MFSQILDALKDKGSDDSTLAGFYAAHGLNLGRFPIEIGGVGKINFSQVTGCFFRSKAWVRGKNIE